MVSKRLFSALTFSVLASARVVPLHPRAEASPAPTDIGFVLNNIADILPNESMMNELHAAASSLMSEVGQPGYEEKAEEYLSSYLSSLNANNDPASASQWASQVVSLLDPPEDIPDKVAVPYSSLISVLHSPQVAGNSADIINELIKLITSVRSIMPELFEDEADTDADTSTEADAASSSIKSTKQSLADSSNFDDNNVSTTKKQETESEQGDLSSDGTAEQTESDGETSGASSNAHKAF
ncbi:hypothetical protein LPJ64_006385, partial [Coemansia asiatica]